jgi:hypothetical protein
MSSFQQSLGAAEQVAEIVQRYLKGKGLRAKL